MISSWPLEISTGCRLQRTVYPKHQLAWYWQCFTSELVSLVASVFQSLNTNPR